MTSQFNILVIAAGNTQTLDDSGPWRSLVDDVVMVSNVGEAHALVGDGAFDLVVAVLDRRGVPSFRDLQQLQQSAPLCRFVAVTGPLCDGVWRRAADQLPSLIVLPWHRWSGWLRSNAGQLGRGLPPAWSMPQTAAVDELAEFWSQAHITTTYGAVGIDCVSRDAAEAIGDMLALAGFASSWHGVRGDGFMQRATALILEADGWDSTVAERVRSLRGRYAEVPLVLLVNFPIPSDISEAQRAGATAILGKPFTLSEFLGQLSELSPSVGTSDAAKVA